MSDKEGNKQGRPYEIPDPNKRSPNKPNVILDRDHVLGIYNNNLDSNDQAKT